MPIPSFYEITGNDPYPWQRRAFARLLQRKIPDAADIPTGLGKTSIVLIHLLALVAGAPLPRRVAYVVDRRAVVDQAATILRLWLRRLAAITYIWQDTAESARHRPALEHLARGLTALGQGIDIGWATLAPDDEAQPQGGTG